MDIFGIITKPIAWVLNWISNLLGGNYFFAILIFAVIVELILLPIAISQQKKSIKQARLRPKEMAIRKKYAGRNDKPTMMRMNEEIQELYQKEGYNPLGGCLPLLIQLPVLIALFNVVNDPLTHLMGLSPDAINQVRMIVGPDTFATTGTMELLNYLHDTPAAFANVEGFVAGSAPSLNVFGVFDMSKTPWGTLQTWRTSLTTFQGWVTVLVPVFTFVSYFFSMKLTRKLTYQPATNDAQSPMGCSPKLMDIVFPLISVFFAFRYAAALGIYWIFKSLLDLLKRVIIAKAMPLPSFTDEEYKEAEREVNAHAEKASKVAKSGRVVRSLHHIDDEDFEDTAEKAKAFKEALEAQEAEEKKAAEEAGTRTVFGGLKMKADRTQDEKAKTTETTEKTEKTEKRSKKKNKAEPKSESKAESADTETDDAQNDDNNKDE